MGRYPDEMIHCICEAMHNICWNPNVKANGYNKSKLKHELNPISRFIKKIS